MATEEAAEGAAENGVDATEHGADALVWSNGPFPGWMIICLCGWSSVPDEECAEAGAQFDEHLEEARE